MPPSYWIPGPALWPLFATCGTALAVCAWSVARNLTSNPDVHLLKSHRSDGAAETGTTLARAKEYSNNMFRSFHRMRKGEGDDRADTRIMPTF